MSIGYSQLNSSTVLDVLHQACMALAIKICSIWAQGTSLRSEFSRDYCNPVP